MIQDKRNTHLRFLALALMVLSLLSIFALSFKFEYSQTWPDKYVYWYTILMCSAGISFLFFIYSLHHAQWKLPLLKSIFIMGLFARLLFIPSQPILEDDFYRYFFDGSVVIHGHNPYITSPNEVQGKPDILFTHEVAVNDQSNNNNTHAGEKTLAYLKQEPLFERVAYPHVQSIYPPVAQVFFGLTAAISPFDLLTWRFVLLAGELATLWLLFKLLSLYRQPKLLIALYWLNPIVIIQGINAAHMDLLLVPFILGALYCLHTARYKSSGFLLALAVGIKLWPIILAPIAAYQIYMRNKPSKKSITLFMTTFVGLTSLMILPQVLAFNYFSGLNQYSQYWQVNGFVFNALDFGIEYVLDDTSISWLEDSNQLSRIVTVGILALFLVYLIRQTHHRVKSKVNNQTNNNQNIAYFCVGYQWLWIIFALFILSPTGYPWYSIWFFPLLVLHFRIETRAMILFTATLPLYSLRYPEPSEAIFNTIIVPSTFAPVLAAIIWQYFKNRTTE